MEIIGRQIHRQMDGQTEIEMIKVDRQGRQQTGKKKKVQRVDKDDRNVDRCQKYKHKIEKQAKETTGRK